VLTFTKDYDEVVNNVPMDRFMTETDAPFAAPVPYRGKRNEPAHVREVVKAIARIKGESEEKVAQQVC
jgi:TatD DNase family protein